jgi:sialic acid synthase SpsE
MGNPMIIDRREIGPDQQPYWISDASCNHHGSLSTALNLMDAAKWAGAHAFKPQLYTADELCKPGTIPTDGPWKGQDLYELYKKYQVPRDWFPVMFDHGRKIGLTVFSSVFSLDGVDYLESLGCPAYKIAANEYNWNPLVDKCLATGKPVLVSVPDFSGADRVGLTKLYNRPGYPLPFGEANMSELRNGKGVFGLSSHIMDERGFVMAVALNTSILEVHLTLDLRDGGPDVSFSWEPAKFRNLIDDCLQAWKAMYPRKTTLPGYRRNLETGLREVA